MSKRPFVILTVAALVCAPACHSDEGDPQQVSSSTNWLMCDTDADCSEFAPASCSTEGYCVDDQGTPIEVAGSSGATNSPTSGTDSTSDADGSTGATSGGSAGSAGTGANANASTSDSGGARGNGTTDSGAMGGSATGGRSNADDSGGAGSDSAGISDGGNTSEAGGATSGGGSSGGGGASPEGGAGNTSGSGGNGSGMSCSATGDPCCDPVSGGDSSYCDGGLECFDGSCIDTGDLNADCIDDSCPDGLTATTYFGIAGASGPEFCSCTIPCAGNADLCPVGSTCATIADGPGTVCVQDEGGSGDECAADGTTGCSGTLDSPTPCCDGLTCCEGVPYPQEGECATECTLRSDRALKTQIRSVDSDEVLQTLSGLPISTWSYRSRPDVAHIGPMAQDFRASFGTGDSDQTIASVDAIGVALASIQALNRRVEVLSRENRQLQRRLEQLESSKTEPVNQCSVPSVQRSRE